MPGPKKAVSAIKRAWTNKVLARVGRRPVVAQNDPQAEWLSNSAYKFTEYPPESEGTSSGGSSADTMRQPAPPIAPLEDYQRYEKGNQFSKLMEAVSRQPTEMVLDAAKKFIEPMINDDRAMVAVSRAIAIKQLDSELKDKDGKPKTGADLKTAQGTLFRANNDWSRLGLAYCVAEPEGATFIDNIKRSAMGRVNGLTASPEIRPDQLREELEGGGSFGQAPSGNGTVPAKRVVTPEMLEAALKERYQLITDMMLGTLDGMMGMKIPKSMAVTIGTTVQAAREASVGDAEIRKLVGAFVLLRIVNPSLTDITMKATAKAGVKELAVTPDQNRMIINITKALQNMANGIMTMTKEKHLQPLMDALQSRQGAMNDWFDRVADESVDLVGGIAGSRGATGGGGASGQVLHDGGLAPGEKGKGKT